MFMKSRFVLLLLMALPALAPAADTPWVAWTTDATKSTVEFQFVQAGAKTEGRFTQFTVDMDFDPAKPADGKIEVTIDMGSADTRDKERDDALKTKDLFDTASFLNSTYVTSQITAKDGGFEATGKLSLRGVSKDVPITFTFESGTDNGTPAATMKGTATIQRLAFGVGQGEWKSTEWIDDSVQVTFNLMLRPRGRAAK